MAKLIRVLLLTSLLAGFLSNGHRSSVAADSTRVFDRRDHPLFLVASYYDAINRGDYARAYNYWKTQPPNGNTLQQFAQGFADLQLVRVLAHLPVATDGAAGTIHANIPVVVLATLKNGREQIYAGCFHSTLSNVPVGNPPVIDSDWYLNDANLQPAATIDFEQAKNACLIVESFPTMRGNDNQSLPIDVVSSYYDAIATGDYVRAYNYWLSGPPGQTLQQFAQGFVGTDNIRVWVPLSFWEEGAAGTAYFSMQILITATYYNVQQFFVGCMVARAPIDTSSPTVDPNWYLHSADITAVATLDIALAQVWDACP